MISVILPCFNAKETVFSTIESIIQSTLSPEYWELIIVDDGSYDGSSLELKQLAEKYTNVNYVYQRNSGVNSARKTGVLMAGYPTITFIDSDDLIRLDYLERALKAISEIDCDVIFFDAENVRATYPRYGLIPSGLLISAILRQKAPNYIYSSFFRKDLLLEIDWSLFDRIKVGEDLLMKLCVLSLVNKVYTSKNIGYIYSPVHTGVMARHVNTFEYSLDYIDVLNNVVAKLAIGEHHTWRSKLTWGYKLLLSTRNSELNISIIYSKLNSRVRSHLFLVMALPAILILRCVKIK